MENAGFGRRDQICSIHSKNKKIKVNEMIIKAFSKCHYIDAIIRKTTSK